jgi:hypothetical protein
MRCPYTDIGCYYIDDVSHDCEADNRKSVCPHEPVNRPENNRASKQEKENEE